MTKEQIENFKELCKIFNDIGERISEKFSEILKIDCGFHKIRLKNNYISITYYDYDDSYYYSENEIDCITIDYEDLLLGEEKVLENLINKRKKEIEFEKELERQKEEENHQKEFQNELELYNKLKKKFEPKYD
jgi:hypothetical protein